MSQTLVGVKGACAFCATRAEGYCQIFYDAEKFGSTLPHSADLTKLLRLCKKNVADAAEAVKKIFG